MGCYRIQPNSITSSQNIRKFRHDNSDGLYGICRAEGTKQSREFAYNNLKPYALSVLLDRNWDSIKSFFKYLGFKHAMMILFVDPLKILVENRGLKINYSKSSYISFTVLYSELPKT